MNPWKLLESWGTDRWLIRLRSSDGTGATVEAENEEDALSTAWQILKATGVNPGKDRPRAGSKWTIPADRVSRLNSLMGWSLKGPVVMQIINETQGPSPKSFGSN